MEYLKAMNEKVIILEYSGRKSCKLKAFLYRRYNEVPSGAHKLKVIDTIKFMR